MPGNVAQAVAATSAKLNAISKVQDVGIFQATSFWMLPVALSAAVLLLVAAALVTLPRRGHPFATELVQSEESE